MKFADCTTRQKRAWTNIRNAASYYIGGLINTCLDNMPGDEDYDIAKNELMNLDELISTVYTEATTTIYSGGGSCQFGQGAERTLRDIRFCGKEFLMKVVTFYCKKYQQEAFDELGIA